MSLNNSTLNVVGESNESTVVIEYNKKQNKKFSGFQTEQELETGFINQLKENGYEYANNIKNEKDLIENLRVQIENLNNIKFTDYEWKTFFNKYISNENLKLKDKTRTIQTDDYIINFEFEDKTQSNIKIIDKSCIHNNKLQVINQFENLGNRVNRYDVSILVNGLPLVHIELKKRGVDLKTAFDQISRYKNESFSTNSALFEWVQIFVISNGTQTKYFSNTTRNQIINQQEIKSKLVNSFSFTSYWSDFNNNRIEDLEEFTDTFFKKHTLLNILTKYCVFNVDEQLLVMRPYQIAATEKIINKVNSSNIYQKLLGTKDAGGYIWHTTGSGKTLTSFKTAQLLSKLDYVHKVLFIVDRKDLDYQTMREYEKFEKGAAVSNISTKELENNLNSDNLDKKILITTIQKLSNFIKANKQHDIYKKHCVLIFDECHRSQFGEMHSNINKHFKKYNMFGFTGTPIFADNAKTTTNTKELISLQNKRNPGYKSVMTTEQLFGERLHVYNIIDAIKDNNVLKFYITTHTTFKQDNNRDDMQVKNIDTETAYLSNQRIQLISEYILKNYSRYTKYNSNDFEYDHKINNSLSIKHKKNNLRVLNDSNKIIRRVKGFNSIFAVSCIEAAKKYYLALKQLIQSNPDYPQLKIGLIYSYAPNEQLDDSDDGMYDENNESTDSLDQSSRDFLESAINDYNKMFNTNWDTSSEKFPSYYKDVSNKLKNKELDMLIVVNMFLTGFDAPTLNTIFIDKKLKTHGLIQAFSRTNRILNSYKTQGNVVCFREELDHNFNEAIKLFGSLEAKGLITIRKFEDYYHGYIDDNNKHISGYVSVVEEFKNKFSSDQALYSTKDKKEFMSFFSKILSIRNILLVFEEFKENDLFAEIDFQNYISRYLDYYNEFKTLKKADHKENIEDDLIFEIDIIKEYSADLDYIINIVCQLDKDKVNNKEVVSKLMRTIDASIELKSKKELIEQFINSVRNKVDQNYNPNEEFCKFNEEYKHIQIKKLCDELNQKFFKDAKRKLESTKINDLIDLSLERGYFISFGKIYYDNVESVSPFSPNSKESTETIRNALYKLYNKLIPI